MSKFYRRLTIVLAILVLVGAIFISRSLAEGDKIPVKTETSPEIIPEVAVQIAENTTVATHFDIQGELVAFEKIDLFSEVPGILKKTSRPFKVGAYFPKGSILLDIDQEEAQLALLAQKSTLQNAITQLMPDLKIDYPESFQQWKTYLDNFDVEQPLQAFPKYLNEQEKHFIATRNILTQYYTIKSAETRLKKYTLHAPFSGVLTMANTYPGGLVQPGQKLGELMNTSNYELRTTVALSDLQYLKTGNEVQLKSDGLAGNWTGRIKRIGDQIDRGTQTATVFIGVSGKNLREGMYLSGQVRAETIADALEIPRDLIINQNAIYVVKNGVLALQTIKVETIIADNAIIKGIENNTQILKEKVAGAFEGMKVKALK